MTSGCLSGDTADSEGENDGEIVLTIWYTFEGKEEDVFLGSIANFEDSEENIKVEAISKPYGSSEQAFVTAESKDTELHRGTSYGHSGRH